MFQRFREEMEDTTIKYRLLYLFNLFYCIRENYEMKHLLFRYRFRVIFFYFVLFFSLK